VVTGKPSDEAVEDGDGVLVDAGGEISVLLPPLVVRLARRVGPELVVLPVVEGVVAAAGAPLRPTAALATPLQKTRRMWKGAKQKSTRGT